MKQTSSRRSLVPATTIIAAVIIIVLLASAIAAAVLVSRARLIAVPDLSGFPVDMAEDIIIEAGLTFALTGTRVSASVPAGQVMAQEPAAGARVTGETTIELVVSAGPQTFVVPDLLGAQVSSATASLEALGFAVSIETASSETTSAIVLEMFPAPGAPVNSGALIRLTVPGGSVASDVLLPYDLSGASVLIDPSAPVGTADAPMEVTRRLRSLLEAAGATVTVTRMATSPAASAGERAQAARTSTAVLLVGLDVGKTGTAGIRVYHLPPGGDATRVERSVTYARAITRAAGLPGLTVNEPQALDEEVLRAFPSTGVRVTLGDSASDADAARFADPAWADTVARSIYRGIGTTYAAP